ncbi:Protein MLTN-13 [Aphelenchoides avenae]|nr:Protein MLTN-13 [Aphelenchus avenae]
MEWLDIVLDVSGAGAALKDVVKRIEPEIKAFHRIVYPAMQRMERMDQQWERLKSSLSPKQRKEAEALGFTFLEDEQKALIYDEERFKRQETHEPDPAVPPESPDTEHGDAPHNVVLTPWAFENRFGGVVLEGVYLSPHAFATEILSPEILTIHALSPRAFIAAVLSPMALFARVLSPTAFHLDVLSPQLLSAYVLTPEAFLADILSPRVLEARVLSPRAMILQVLTPEIVAPRIGSAERYGVIVLSPHILGGEHEKHEAKNGTSDAHGQHQQHSGGLNLGEAIHIYPELPANEGPLGHPRTVV